MAHLSAAPIDPASLVAQVESPAHGGVSSFLGLVRNHHGGRAVQRLEYSAYGPMAEAECALEIGDIAVAVAAAGAHRDEAFAACRFVIEEVKRRVPIWKKEFYQDGAVEWVDPTSAAAPHEVLDR